MKSSALLNAVILTTVSVFSSVTLASDKAPGSGPNPFSDCGIGAALFPKTKWAAVSSNVIWDIGTTAVTSATASPETCSGKAVETAMFIHQTYDQLVEETAKGQGEHMTAMLDMVGCTPDKHSLVSGEIRSTMRTVVNSNGYNQMGHTEKASAYYDSMSNAASKHCGVIGA